MKKINIGSQFKIKSWTELSTFIKKNVWVVFVLGLIILISVDCLIYYFYVASPSQRKTLLTPREVTINRQSLDSINKQLKDRQKSSTTSLDDNAVDIFNLVD